jgi:uncharacterized membrane protein
MTRAIVWRLIATALTVPFTGLATAVFLHVLLTVVHYIHERAWLKIKWGINNE